MNQFLLRNCDSHFLLRNCDSQLTKQLTQHYTWLTMMLPGWRSPWQSARFSATLKNWIRYDHASLGNESKISPLILIFNMILKNTGDLYKWPLDQLDTKDHCFWSWSDLLQATVWGGNLSWRFCKMFSESSLACLGSTAAALQPQGLWYSQKTFYKTLFTTWCPRL